MRYEGKQSGSMVCCQACGTKLPVYDVVNFGSLEQGYRELCTRCFNAEVARALGLKHFENVRLDPVELTDCAGERHAFHFRMRLLGFYRWHSRPSNLSPGSREDIGSRSWGNRTTNHYRFSAACSSGCAEVFRQTSRKQRARHADCRSNGTGSHRMGWV